MDSVTTRVRLRCTNGHPMLTNNNIAINIDTDRIEQYQLDGDHILRRYVTKESVRRALEFCAEFGMLSEIYTHEMRNDLEVAYDVSFIAHLNGRISIGCKDFDEESSELIRKWATS